jgi:hypothetical protein
MQPFEGRTGRLPYQGHLRFIRLLMAQPMTRRARHLRPTHHQVSLTILLLPHRHCKILPLSHDPRESDIAKCGQDRLRQRAANLLGEFRKEFIIDCEALRWLLFQYDNRIWWVDLERAERGWTWFSACNYRHAPLPLGNVTIGKFVRKAFGDDPEKETQPMKNELALYCTPFNRICKDYRTLGYMLRAVQRSVL